MTTISVPAAQPDQAGPRNPAPGASRKEPRAVDRVAFERLLSDRQARRGAGDRSESERESGADLGQPPQTAAMAPRVPSLALTPTLTTASPSSGVIHNESASAIRQGDQARMADHAVTASVHANTDSPGTWHAILPNALSGDWQLRATREAGTAAGPQSWLLAIGTPAAAAGLLARHAVRLVERLQERLPGRSVRVSVDPADAASSGSESNHTNSDGSAQYDEYR